MKIKHEKSDVFYQRTKTLILTHHEPRVQAIMMDHATEEYTQKLQEILVREEHFHGVIQQLGYNNYMQLSINNCIDIYI